MSEISEHKSDSFITENSVCSELSNNQIQSAVKVPKNEATKELIKNDYKAIKKFTSIEIKHAVNQYDEKHQELDAIYEVDFDEYLSKLTDVALNMNDFWEKNKSH